MERLRTRLMGFTAGEIVLLLGLVDLSLLVLFVLIAPVATSVFA